MSTSDHNADGVEAFAQRQEVGQFLSRYPHPLAVVGDGHRVVAGHGI